MKKFLFLLIMLLCTRFAFGQSGYYEVISTMRTVKTYRGAVCKNDKYHYRMVLKSTSGATIIDHNVPMRCKTTIDETVRDTAISAIDQPLGNIGWDCYINTRANNNTGCGGGCNGDLDDTNIQRAVSGANRCTSYVNSNYHERNENVLSSTSYTVTVTPIVKTLAQSGLIMPSDDPVTVTAPSGFTDDTYQWEYSYLVPNGMQSAYSRINWASGPKLSVTGRDLFGDNYLNLLLNNATIFIRVTTCNGRASDDVTFKPVISSPHIIRVDSFAAKCNGQTNGNVKVTFDRQLNADESLNVFLTAVPTNRAKDRVIENIRVLNAGNTVTFNSDIIPGTYQINLIGISPVSASTGGVTYNTYTSATNHKANVKVLDPDPVIFSLIGKADVSCYGGTNGSIRVQVSGGTKVYKISYQEANDADPTEITANGAGVVVLSNLKKGTYTVKVKDSNDCTGANTAGQTALSMSVGAPDTRLAVINPVVQDPLSYGASNGFIQIRIAGGTPSYTIRWTDLNRGRNLGTDLVVNGLADGRYALRITDANNCSFDTIFTLVQPQPIAIDLKVKDSISCYGVADGLIVSTVTGGVQLAGSNPYVYTWYRVENGSDVNLGEANATIANIPAGQYRLKVRDKNGIEKTSDIINLITPGELQMNLQMTPVSCYSGSNGALTAVMSGGTLPYQYTWSTTATSQGISGLSTGYYSVSVKDYHGCALNRGTTVTQPATPLQIATPVGIQYPLAYGYSDGSIEVTIKGGTAKANGSYNVTWKKADGTVITATNTVVAGGYKSVVAGLPAGDYTISVTDANYTGTGAASDQQACHIEDTYKLIEPDPLVVNVSMEHYVSCKNDQDGVLKATGAGGIQIPGAAPYLYKWYVVKNGVTTQLAHSTDLASNLPAGTYKVIITDKNGITKESALFNLTEPDLLQMSLAARAVSCNGGTDGFVKTTVTGGTLNYTYTWSNGAATADIIHVAAGQYSVHLADGHGCIVNKDTTIIEPAAPLTITDVTPVDPLAFGYTDGYIRLTLSGGTPAYAVEWMDDHGATLTNFTKTNTADGVVVTLQNVGDGTYTMYVKDAHYNITTDGSTAGCYIAGTYTLTEPPLLVATVTEHKPVSCKGKSDGQLIAHAEGGIPRTGGLPYQYHWYRVDNGVETTIPQTDSIITGMKTGTYLVRVTDANNITRSSATYYLVEPDLLQISFTAQAVTCSSGQDGMATANVAGGTLPYHYEWTTGDTTQIVSNLNEGTYFLFVTDGRGCIAQNQLDIYIPDGIRTDPVVNNPICIGECNGSITLHMSGGVPGYTYLWEDGSTDKDRTGLCAGKYSVTIHDQNNCIRIQSFTLTNPAPVVVNVGPDKTLCNGQSWTIDASIDDAGASYLWTNDNGFTATTPAVTIVEGGDYRVTVTTGKQCQGRDTITIKKYQADIEAEFVSPTQAFTGETVSFVNISDPMPEWVEWIIPQEKSVTLVQQTTVLAEVKFADTGTYNIQMRAHIGDCEKVFNKTVTILKSEQMAAPGGAKTPFIQTFEVMPNLNQGQFSVRVVLDKQSDIRLRMINIVSDQLVSDRKENGGQQYNLNYQLNVPSGTYLMLLETPLGSAVRKIVVNK